MLKLTAGVSFDIRGGEIHGLIGESGCGKSISSLAIMGMLPEPDGVLCFRYYSIQKRENIFSLDQTGLNALRGDKISMIFQEPFAAMNPLIRIGDQMLEVFEYHSSDFDGKQKIRNLLNEVGLTDHARILKSFPHELSGGMLKGL